MIVYYVYFSPSTHAQLKIGGWEAQRQCKMVVDVSMGHTAFTASGYQLSFLGLCVLT